MKSIRHNYQLDAFGNCYYINLEGKFWVDDDRYWHRDDGPAVKYTNGDIYWWVHGKCHRENGPAVEYRNGDIYWYFWGINYEFKNWLRKTPISLEEKILLKLRYG